jgi:hypothetical protein
LASGFLPNIDDIIYLPAPPVSVQTHQKREKRKKNKRKKLWVCVTFFFLPKLLAFFYASVRKSSFAMMARHGTLARRADKEQSSTTCTTTLEDHHYTTYTTTVIPLHVLTHQYSFRNHDKVILVCQVLTVVIPEVCMFIHRESRTLPSPTNTPPTSPRPHSSR